MAAHRIQLAAPDSLGAHRVADGRTASASGATTTATAGSGGDDVMTTAAMRRLAALVPPLAAEAGRDLLRREFATPTAATLGIGDNQQLRHGMNLR
jgi:hypothetical protein